MIDDPVNPLSTRRRNLKAKKWEKLPFLASLKSLWTNQKGCLSPVNHPLNHGSYFDWCAFSKAD